jgi:hypothetical protein
MWISTNVTNIYLASIRFGTLKYICNTLYKNQRIPTVLEFLPYILPLHMCGVFGWCIWIKWTNSWFILLLFQVTPFSNILNHCTFYLKKSILNLDLFINNVSIYFYFLMNSLYTRICQGLHLTPKIPKLGLLALLQFGQLVWRIYFFQFIFFDKWIT